MAVATMTRCDCDCGASSDAPGEQGWWLIETEFGFQVVKWNDLLANDLKHAAGMECAHKLLNQWFDRQREGK